MRKKEFVTVIAASLLLVSLAAGMHSSLSQTGTQVSGVIGQDTIWTKVNSPYSLTGPIAVNNGVTLTIEEGATVNLYNYNMHVNGELIIQGSGADQIAINGASRGERGTAQIIFTSTSNGWNDQTGTGCTIENAILNSTSISSDVPLKISNSKIYGTVTLSGSSIIENSLMFEIAGNASLINNNTITGNATTTVDFLGFTVSEMALNIQNAALISNNNINGFVSAKSSTLINNTINGGIESSTISNNTINAFSDVFVTGSTITSNKIYGDVSVNAGLVANNTIEGGISLHDRVGRAIGGGFAVAMNGSCTILNNTIISGDRDASGITTNGDNSLVYGNSLVGFEFGISGVASGNVAKIERNLVRNCTYGVIIDYVGNGQLNMIVSNNTISNCSVGIIYGWNSTSVFTFNNLQNNTQNFFLADGVSVDIDATYNWWGTIDVQTINQSIHDFKNDFDLGKVTFIPFLDSPNPQAPANPATAPTPTNSPTPTLAPTSTLPPAITSPTSRNSSSPNPSPSVPEFQVWIVLPFLVSVAALAFFVIRKRKAAL